MVTALKNFAENYMNLFRFYFTLVSHLKNEQNNLKIILVSIISAKNQAQFIKNIMETLSETGKLDDTFRSILFSKLQTTLDIEDSTEELDIVRSLIRSIYQDAGFSQSAIENFSDKVLEDLRKTDGENMDLDDYFQIFFKAGVELKGPDSGIPPSLEIDSPKNYNDFISQFKELISDISGNEPKLLINLYSMCIVQLWSHFETFLKDAASEILLNNPPPSIGIYGIKFIKKKTWRRARDFFEWELNFSIFPDDHEITEGYQNTWHLDPQFKGHPRIKNYNKISLRTRLADFHTIRNIIVHENGKFNGKPILLNEAYIQYNFTFIKHIVNHLALQLEDYIGEM